MRRGFTLLELLVTVSLLIMISACVVFNFSSAEDRMLLDDGVTNIQTLIRFSRAHSINTGKTVKILFPDSELGDEGETLRQKYPNDTVVVLVDDEPLDSTKYYVDAINNSVRVETTTKNEIIFYPDGMNEDIVMTVGSVSEEDPRKIEISVTSFTTKLKESSSITDTNF